MSPLHAELRITIDGVAYDAAQVAAGTASPHNPLASRILAFCHAWWSGQDTFTSATSGSTGKPKKMVFTRSQMTASARKIGSALKWKKGYTALVCLDSKHIAGRMMLVRSLVWGMHIYAAPPSADPLLYVPDDVSLDVAAFVPYQLDSMLRSQSREKLNRIRCTLIGGSSVPRRLTAPIAALQGDVYATYGMTETLAAIALQKLNGIDAQSCLQALPGVTIGRTSEGCLTVQADYLPHTIVTTDVVNMKGDNGFIWRGRKDNIINSGGIKIAPEEIESAVHNVCAAHKLHGRSFIAGVPDPILGQRVALIIEGSPFDDALQQKLLKALKAELPPYSTPREIRFIKHFITTRLGKISRTETLRQKSLSMER